MVFALRISDYKNKRNPLMHPRNWKRIFFLFIYTFIHLLTYIEVLPFSQTFLPTTKTLISMIMGNLTRNALCFVYKTIPSWSVGVYTVLPTYVQNLEDTGQGFQFTHIVLSTHHSVLQL